MLTNAQHKALASYILAAGGAILATDAQLHFLPPWTAGAIIAIAGAYQGWRHQSDTSVETPQTPSLPVQRDLRAEIPPGHFHAENANSEQAAADPIVTQIVPPQEVGDNGLTAEQEQFVREQIKEQENG